MAARRDNYQKHQITRKIIALQAECRQSSAIKGLNISQRIQGFDLAK